MNPTVLILCTGNSCRSHLAEGNLRAAVNDLVDVQSAGSKPAGYVHPLAIRVMTEIGIDISDHRSKHLNEFLQKPVETVITVCGNADHACPIFPGQVNRYHWGFDDPAKAEGTEDEKLKVFRRVRDAEVPDLLDRWLSDRGDWQGLLDGLARLAAGTKEKSALAALHLRIADNHDEKRAITFFGERAALAAFALVFTMDGVPLLYNGNEVGDATESFAPALFEKLPVWWQMRERRPEIPGVLWCDDPASPGARRPARRGSHLGAEHRRRIG